MNKKELIKYADSVFDEFLDELQGNYILKEDATSRKIAVPNKLTENDINHLNKILLGLTLSIKGEFVDHGIEEITGVYHGIDYPDFYNNVHIYYYDSFETFSYSLMDISDIYLPIGTVGYNAINQIIFSRNIYDDVRIENRKVYEVEINKLKDMFDVIVDSSIQLNKCKDFIIQYTSKFHYFNTMIPTNNIVNQDFWAEPRNSIHTLFRNRIDSNLSRKEKDYIFAYLLLKGTNTIFYDYVCDNNWKLFLSLIDHLQANNITRYLDRCKLCGKYFVPSKKGSSMYCENVMNGKKTCKSKALIYNATHSRNLKTNFKIEDMEKTIKSLLKQRAETIPEHKYGINFEKEYYSFLDDNKEYRHKVPLILYPNETEQTYYEWLEMKNKKYRSMI